MTYQYSAYQLHITSDLPLNLPHSIDNHTQSSISIKAGPVHLTQKLPFLLGDISYGYIAENELVVRVPNIADFQIMNHSVIIYQPFTNVREEEIASYLMSIILLFIVRTQVSCMVHGSAAVYTPTGQAVVLVGYKGAGKSTTATALSTHQFTLLGDDVVPLQVNNPSKVSVFPGIPTPRLMHDALQLIFHTTIEEKDPESSSWKYQVTPPNKRGLMVSPLSLLCVLTPDSTVQEMQVRSLQGIQKVQAIAPHLVVIPSLDDPAQVLYRATEVVQAIEMIQIIRPVAAMSTKRIAQIVDYITSRFEG